jgi:hypothetical protein
VGALLEHLVWWRSAMPEHQASRSWRASCKRVGRRRRWPHAERLQSPLHRNNTYGLW